MSQIALFQVDKTPDVSELVNSEQKATIILAHSLLVGVGMDDIRAWIKIVCIQIDNLDLTDVTIGMYWAVVNRKVYVGNTDITIRLAGNGTPCVEIWERFIDNIRPDGYHCLKDHEIKSLLKKWMSENMAGILEREKQNL